MLTDKYVEWYKKLIEFVAWLLIITGIIAGFVIGKGMAPRRSSGIGQGLLGALIGGGGMFLFEAILFPPLIILFKLHDKANDVQNEIIDVYNAIAEFYNGTVENPDSKKPLNSSSSNSEERPYVPVADREKVESGETKICKKCGAQNPVTSVTCKDCGEYL